MTPHLPVPFTLNPSVPGSLDAVVVRSLTPSAASLAQEAR